MPKLTALDEYFVHQIPEPLPSVVTHHQHWRESLFFVLHPRDRLGDVVILTMALFPARGELDSLQLGMVGSTPTVARHARPAGDDPHSFDVGPVHIEIVEPYQKVRLRVEDGIEVPVALDLTFTARTAPYGLRRGTMRAGHELIWDQSHMLQSGHISTGRTPTRAAGTRSTTGGASATTRGASATTPAVRSGCGWRCSCPTA